MGYFYNKYAESAVEDTIQTVDDIGNDLEQIEKDIEGADGIEAHRDEVEDALDGMVGDPVDECMIMIAESEYNWNQMMKEMGLEELAEAAAADGKTENKTSFIDKAVKFFQDIARKIGEMISNAIDRLVHGDHTAFVKKNKDAIERGFYSGDWNVKIPDLELTFERADKILKKLTEADPTTFVVGAKPEEDIIEELSGYKAKTIQDMAKQIMDIPVKEYSSNERGSGDKPIEVNVVQGKGAEKRKSSIRDLKDAGKKAVRSCNEIIKDLKSGKKTDMNHVENLNNVKFALNVIRQMQAVSIKLLNTYFSADYAVARALLAADPGDVKKNEEVKGKNESFMNFNII